MATPNKYENKYNKYVVSNSNSYGMAYSDAAHAKVQFLTSGNVTVDLHVFGASNEATGNYYNAHYKPPVSPPSTGKYSLGIGGNSEFGQITYGRQAFQKNSDGAYGGIFSPLPGWQKLRFSNPPNTYIWIKLEGDGAVVGGDCIDPGGIRFQQSNEFRCLTAGAGCHWKDGAKPPPKPTE